MIKVLHVTPSLTVGGAELMLFRLVSNMSREFQSEVVCLTQNGPVGDRLRGIGVPVTTLGMKRGVPNPAGLITLCRILVARRPGIVQTWMYQGDLLGGLASRLAFRGRCIWNIRNGTLDARRSKALTFWTRSACARLSGVVPQRIVCCSEVARSVHEQIGYSSKKMVVIANGFDVEQFRPRPEMRAEMRRRLGLPEECLIAGLVARFDPQKDHETFAAAAGLVAARVPNVRFVLCGDGVNSNNELLRGWLEKASVTDRCVLLGRRDDIANVTASFDVAISSSRGEAFSNSVGEAMASSVACVVTDVGDSPLIVGQTGVVVRPEDPVMLAEAITALLRDEGARAQMGVAARERIIAKFSLDRTIAAYETLYREVS